MPGYTGTLDPVSNAETWTDTLEFIDTETGTAYSLTDVTAMTLKLRDPENDSIVLEGSLADGDLVKVGGDTAIEFTFSADTMSGIDPKTYEVGVLMTTATRTTQSILGRLPVLRGL